MIDAPVNSLIIFGLSFLVVYGFVAITRAIRRIKDKRFNNKNH